VGYTITEKILARASERDSVRAGDDIRAKPDFVLAYDYFGYTDVYFESMKKDFGIDRVVDPQRYGIFIDHLLTRVTDREEELHRGTRAWCAANGVELFERRGIGHQVATEVGFATPGAFVVHFDGHVSQLGAFGTLAIGLRRNILEAFVRERIAIQVPATVLVELRGQLQRGVMARDVLHHLVRVLGPASCRKQVLELGGEGLSQFSNEGLQTITGLAMFAGALTAIVNPDDARLAYALPRARKKLAPVSSDPDANYSKVHYIDLDELVPIIVIPPSPANTRKLTDYLGLAITHAYLGSCAAGRIEDLRAAAAVLRGRRVSPAVQLNVVPSSQEIWDTATKEGLLAVFIEAGAVLSIPGCDHCFGRAGAMAAGQRAVSTGTLNVRGRMGSPDSEIYLCNAAVVAASAVAGAIADPRLYLQ
jgi:3-isopropylmalate/(R)-2-methylmalate dehydratase large subunit